MLLVTRSQWGARSPRSQASYLASTRGVKVHYMGSYVDPRLKDDHTRCAALARQIQNGHMDGNGWNDVGYSYLACPHRYVFEGRGLHRLPAANGPNLNTGHYAVLGMVGNKGLTAPTDDMLHGIRDAIEYLREKGAAGSEIKGHRDGYSTDCPGAHLYAWVRDGAPRPKTTTPAKEQDDMPLTKDDVQTILNTDGFIDNPVTDPKNPKVRLNWLLTDDSRRLRRIEAILAGLTGQPADVDEAAIIKGVLEGLSPQLIAAAVAEALPDELARQVVTELATRLDG